MDSEQPTVLLLDGDSDTALALAKELTEDLEVGIIGAGTTRYSRLLRSNYCEQPVIVPQPGAETYDDALLTAIRSYHPDVVLPVGYESTASINAIRADVPADVSLCLPPTESFRTAVDKDATLQCGRQLGLDTPADYSDLVADLEAAGRPPVDESLEFPVFLKARRENGDATTGFVDEPDAFWAMYDRIASSAPESDVLVQEYVDGSESTYGCGLLCFDNEVQLAYTHEELRSVPRRGGSGTHLRLRRDDELKRKATRLLQEIGWHGVALVEFKRRSDGTVVLMEINPKFWASYALASRFGYRFASTVVANELDLEMDLPIGSPRPTGEMVFPLRELHFQLRNRSEASLSAYLTTVFQPDAAWDIDRRDLGAWLTPPASFIQKLPGIATTKSLPEALPRWQATRETPSRADETDDSVQSKRMSTDGSGETAR